MADIITGTTTGFVNNTPDSTLQGVSDIRREAEVAAALSQLENMKGFDRVNSDVLKTGWANSDVTKDARHDIVDRIAGVDANSSAQNAAYFIAQQKNATDAAAVAATTAAVNEAGILALQNSIAASANNVATANALAAATNAAAIQLDAAKNAAANALAQQMIGQQIVADGDRTRALINDHKYHDLNRLLVERNAEIVEERHESRHYRDRYGDAQNQGMWTNLQSQLQMFQSQLTETRQAAQQGTVNFGTMSGNAGRNTSTNNVV